MKCRENYLELWFWIGLPISGEEMDFCPQILFTSPPPPLFTFNSILFVSIPCHSMVTLRGIWPSYCGLCTDCDSFLLLLRRQGSVSVWNITPKTWYDLLFISRFCSFINFSRVRLLRHFSCTVFPYTHPGSSYFSKNVVHIYHLYRVHWQLIKVLS